MRLDEPCYPDIIQALDKAVRDLKELTSPDVKFKVIQRLCPIYSLSKPQYGYSVEVSDYNGNGVVTFAASV